MGARRGGGRRSWLRARGLKIFRQAGPSVVTTRRQPGALLTSPGEPALSYSVPAAWIAHRHQVDKTDVEGNAARLGGRVRICAARRRESLYSTMSAGDRRQWWYRAGAQTGRDGWAARRTAPGARRTLMASDDRSLKRPGWVTDRDHTEGITTTTRSGRARHPIIRQLDAAGKRLPVLLFFGLAARHIGVYLASPIPHLVRKIIEKELLSENPDLTGRRLGQLLRSI